MGTQQEELEREIAQTRAELGKALDQIEYKVSPRRIISDNRERIELALGAIAALLAVVAGMKIFRSRRRRRLRVGTNPVGRRPIVRATRRHSRPRSVALRKP